MAKSAVVVGAAGGVGLCVSQRLVAQGWDVIAVVRNSQHVDRLNSEVPGTSEILHADLENADHLGPVILPALERRGSLDAAIMCAAISPYGPLEVTPLDNFRRTLEINTLSPLALYQSCIRFLRSSHGRLVLVSSMAGRVAFPFIGHYSASKFALEALADAMRREGGPQGPEIVLVEPAGIRTGMIDGQLRTIEKDRAALAPESRELYDQFYVAHAAGLAGAAKDAMPPDEVAEIVMLSLAAETPQTRYVVGPIAQNFISMADTLSDRKLDTAIALRNDRGNR